ncbi:MAG: M28 family peptidase [Chloroflexi bacterium]|nr:M28 family peptidase [Chloroflexota bacterium]
MTRRGFLRLSAVALAGGGAAVVLQPLYRVWLPQIGRGPAPAAPLDAPRFDGQRAFALLRAQVAFGPRNPGSSGHAQCRAWLLDELSAVCERTAAQDLAVSVRGQRLALSNLIGLVRPAAERQVLLCAHWDTRPWADQDPNPANRRTPILGANDGASGVAAVLELARVLAATPADFGVVVVLFDGEDYGPGIEDMFLGSRYYADHIWPDRPAYGILLDMVGDRNLTVYQEVISTQRAPEVVARVWSAAARLGYEAVFPPVPKYVVYDDHVPLLDRGVPVIDVVDFDYPPWHTLGDTVEQCAAASLQVVGETVLEALTGG